MNYDIFVLFILTFFASAFFTWYVRRILIRAKIGDSPIVSEHKHKIGTPTMGGIAFLFTILLVTSIYYKNTIILIFSFMMLAGGIFGLVDDLIGLQITEVQKLVVNTSKKVINLGRLEVKPDEEVREATPKAKAEVDKLLEDGKVELVGEVPIKLEPEELPKILCQIFIGLLLGLTGYVTNLGGFSLGWLMFPVVIIAILGAINAVNLIDGMDGLAAGIITIASISCCIYGWIIGRPDILPPFAILAGICLGFLIFNRYPASIFMGDTGSFILGVGFATAVLICDIPYFGVLSLGVPIFSVIVSLLHRAHIINLPVEPLHHTLNHRGMSEVKIVSLYWLGTVALCAIGIIGRVLLF